jgi:probable rRNA maturation factor
VIVKSHARGRIRRLPIGASRVARAVRAAIGRRDPGPRAEAHVIFVDNRAIRLLNRRYLDTSGLTDVIAFPYPAPPSDARRAPWSWGDVYISVPVARANARRYGDAEETEMTRLVVHGVLHLLGYSDHRPQERARMWKRQEALVRRLCGVARRRHG